ncbi:MAG: HNH endonuclease [Alphaproteobacteria bacterium]|nr:MAG: HNH endonuclease [Alphaproteobacteria bacterium]
MAFDEASYRRWLSAQDLDDRTKADQLSRVRRLDRRFGDLDEAFARDGLASLMDLLSYGSADGTAGRPLPGGLTFDGDAVSGMRSLKSAARKYQSYKVATAGATGALDLTTFRPVLPPREAPGRDLAPSGFWMLQANPERYDTDGWIAAGETSLLYLVSRDDADLIQPGDLAVLRRTTYKGRSAALVAFFEISSAPEVRPQPDVRFFTDPAEGQPQPRVMLELLTAPAAEIPATSLPDKPEFRNIRRGLQRTTTAIPREAFEHLARMADLSPLDVLATRSARTLSGVRALDTLASDLDPKRQEVVSKRIERGPIGGRVKEKLGGRCQLCVQLGRDPVAFRKADGKPFAEAHHVVPVSTLAPGSLAAINVMVLCPNHHRQAHHGRFEIVRDQDDSWVVRLDGRELIIEKTKL